MQQYTFPKRIDYDLLVQSCPYVLVAAIYSNGNHFILRFIHSDQIVLRQNFQVSEYDGMSMFEGAFCAQSTPVGSYGEGFESRIKNNEYWIDTLFYAKKNVWNPVPTFEELCSFLRTVLHDSTVEVHSIVGDGNCGFSVVAWWVYGDVLYHPNVRQDVCSYMLQHVDSYVEAFAPAASDEAQTFIPATTEFSTEQLVLAHINRMRKLYEYPTLREFFAVLECYKDIGLNAIVILHTNSDCICTAQILTRQNAKDEQDYTSANWFTSCTAENSIILVYQNEGDMSGNNHYDAVTRARSSSASDPRKLAVPKPTPQSLQHQRASARKGTEKKKT